MIHSKINMDCMILSNQETHCPIIDRESVNISPIDALTKHADATFIYPALLYSQSVINLLIMEQIHSQTRAILHASLR